MIFTPSIEIVKEKSKGKRLVFDIKTNFGAPINVQTSIIDSYKQKTHVKMSNHIDTTHFRYFVDHRLYSKHLLASNKLTFFTEITRITDLEICSKDNNNKSNYLQMLSCFESSSSSSDLKVTEFKIDAKTGEIVTLNPEIEKLEQLENVIEEQTTALDNIINNVTNIFHEHYFENANLNGVLVNTNSQSNFGNVSIAQTDCTVLIEKLEEIVIREIKPVLDQNEQMCSEIKEIKSCNEVLVNVSLENQLEIAHLQTELNQMKRDKQVKQSKMKQIVDRIIALLSRIKCELIKVGSSIKSIVTQAKKSSSKSTSNRPNLINYIESYTSSLIKLVQDVQISSSVTQKSKENRIAKLKNVQKFLISNLPTENSGNEDFNVDSITMDNYADKMYDLIYGLNAPSELDYRSILVRLTDLLTYGE